MVVIVCMLYVCAYMCYMCRHPCVVNAWYSYKTTANLLNANTCYVKFGNNTTAKTWKQRCMYYWNQCIRLPCMSNPNWIIASPLSVNAPSVHPMQHLERVIIYWYGQGKNCGFIIYVCNEELMFFPFLFYFLSFFSVFSFSSFKVFLGHFCYSKP